MKHCTLVLLCLLVWVVPTFAQDTSATQEPSPVTVNVEAPPQTTEQAFTTSWLLAGLLVVSILFSGYAMTLLSKFIHPEQARALIQSGIQMGLEVGRTQAASTLSSLDDRLLEIIAANQGYDLIKRADGTYEARPRQANPAGSAAMADANTEPDPMEGAAVSSPVPGGVGQNADGSTTIAYSDGTTYTVTSTHALASPGTDTPHQG